MEKHHRIAVAGTGPAGLIAALSLHQMQHDVVLIGPEPTTADARTTALMMPAVRFLQKMGVWSHIEPHAAPLRTMRIVDGTSRLIRGTTVTFQASEIGEEAFGYNIPNARLNAVLNDAAVSAGFERITANVARYDHSDQAMHIRLENGDEVDVELVVAADGRSSLARESAGITTKVWKYPQTAIVLCFSHTRDHHDVSTEFHTENGPFTLVPLGEKRSSLVWVVNPATADDLLQLDNEDLSRRIEERMQSMLGAVTVDSRPQSWPLSGLIPTAFARNRTVLIGEAAHVFPPIGAQGLNLGIRDVESLCECLDASIADLGTSSVLDGYNRSRRFDILARTGSIDVLNRSLLTGFLPAQMARSVVLEALRVFSPLRTLVMREGLRPGGGFSAFGSARGEKVGRQNP